jgi:hypothetical protein
MASNSDNLIIGGLAVLLGGTLLASLLGDRHKKSRRRARSIAFYDDESELGPDVEEEVDLSDDLDLEDETAIRHAKVLPTQEEGRATPR